MVAAVNCVVKKIKNGKSNSNRNLTDYSKTISTVIKKFTFEQEK
jgi:hypothetical protein